MAMKESHENPPANWWSKAECVKEDPELFFPHRQNIVQNEMAKRVCERCVVRLQCLAKSLEEPELYGVWGGVGELERKRMLMRSSLKRSANSSR